MDLPNLNRIIDTYIPVTSIEPPAYLNQLRRELLPHIRELQSGGYLRWYSFLLHEARHLSGREPENGHLFIHIRLEPATDLDLKAFVKTLPDHFCKPQQIPLSKISGLDGGQLHDNDWAHAWKIHGEASDWVLRLLEGHEDGPSLQQMIQFLHFITNPLMLGHQCLCIPAGFLQF